MDTVKRKETRVGLKRKMHTYMLRSYKRMSISSKGIALLSFDDGLIIKLNN